MCGDPTDGYRTPSRPRLTGVCSTECSGIWRGWCRRRDSTPKRYRICRVCGVAFLARYRASTRGRGGVGTFCSTRCSGTIGYSPGSPRCAPIDCAACGQSYHIGDSTARFPHRFCSPKCQYSTWGDCPVCGRRFYGHRPDRVYCSERCGKGRPTVLIAQWSKRPAHTRALKRT